VDIDDLDIDVSGTLLTQDPDTDFSDFLIINAVYGAENPVAHGILCPDEYRVFKPFIDGKCQDPIVGRTLGSRELREVRVNDAKGPVQEERPASGEQHHFALLPRQILQLAQLAKEIEIESQKPLEIAWIHDRESNNFYITKIVDLDLSQPDKPDSIAIYDLQSEDSHLLVEGIAIGSGIVHGETCLIANLSAASDFVDGSILVTHSIDHHWLPLLKKAKGVVTNQGGRASEAASLCRKLSIPAILGSAHATRRLKDGQKVTLDCAHCERGKAYRDYLQFQCSMINLENLPNTTLNRRLSIDSPDSALRWWKLPSQGFGMAKIEEIISDDIGVHPMALINYDTLEDEGLQLKIDHLTAGYDSPTEYFVDRLARGIATMAAVAYPDPIVVRLNDFTSDHYRHLLDRGLFEPLERNPQMGLRGATRYLSDHYRQAFELECQAISRARSRMGFTNIDIAIPYCRTVQQAKETIELIEANGLDRRDDDLEVHLIAEVPSNIILAPQFLDLFDGVAIDLDTLTQVVLCIDAQEETTEGLLNHEDAAVLSSIALLVRAAHKLDLQVTVFGHLKDHRSELMKYLIEEDIDGFALEPENFVRGSHQIAEAEELFLEDSQPIDRHDKTKAPEIQNPPHHRKTSDHRSDSRSGRGWWMRRH
ncbi:PEP-utilizing enzyme, partial [bacterium]|nr:PEP-utilizing enzyme [bacterium]